jgi:hypothetical protein
LKEFCLFVQHFLIKIRFYQNCPITVGLGSN